MDSISWLQTLQKLIRKKWHTVTVERFSRSWCLDITGSTRMNLATTGVLGCFVGPSPTGPLKELKAGQYCSTVCTPNSGWLWPATELPIHTTHVEHIYVLLLIKKEKKTPNNNEHRMLPKWNSGGRETYTQYCLNRRTLREYSKLFAWKPINLHVWSKGGGGVKDECERPFMFLI